MFVNVLKIKKEFDEENMDMRVNKEYIWNYTEISKKIYDLSDFTIRDIIWD